MICLSFGTLFYANHRGPHFRRTPNWSSTFEMKLLQVDAEDEASLDRWRRFAAIQHIRVSVLAQNLIQTLTTPSFRLIRTILKASSSRRVQSVRQATTIIRPFPFSTSYLSSSGTTASASPSFSYPSSRFYSMPTVNKV